MLPLRSLLALLLLPLLTAAQTGNMTIRIQPGERWWFGATALGDRMPLETGFTADVRAYLYGNQVQPLLLSSRGRGVWSGTGFTVAVGDSTIELAGSVTGFVPFRAGNTLREAYRHASRTFFPPDGRLPDTLLFTAPQYNTWIELQYDQNQADILAYARAIVANGMPPGVLMIDDTWQTDYGKWEFNPARFPDPRAMVDELHRLGFRVMLWVCPFVSPDSEEFRAGARDGILLRDPDPNRLFRGHRMPQMVPWWNGVSAVLDLSNPTAQRWFADQLDRLQRDYGVDGFKLDAGDAEFYVHGEPFVAGTTPNEQSTLFAEVGLDYPLNEYRACFRLGGRPLVQRLRDKAHSWADLQRLVPQMITAGLAGYAFSCPDMIGGGEFTSFLPGADLDQELIVRSAQVHALMPMMQFSVAPWRVLDSTHQAALLASVRLRERFRERILAEAGAAATTGEPMLRPLEYNYPGQNLTEVTDQFMIGTDLLVAPVVEPSARSRAVRLPPGRWRGPDGREHAGGRTITVAAELDDLPYFRLVTE